MKTCGRCHENLPNTRFYRRDASKDGLAHRCKLCDKAAVAEWRADNPDRAKAGARQRAAASQARLRREVLALYGDRCAHCNIGDPRVLQIDHVEGGGYEHRQRRGSSGVLRDARADKRMGGKQFQLLCANCNWIKRHENGETR